jgi:diguanylate cyclase (GGDEF)-like protein
VYQAEVLPSGGPGPLPDAGYADPEQGRDAIQLVLEHTLSIMTAVTDGQLLARTLAAACEVSGASIGFAVAVDGTIHTPGDPALGEQLAQLGVSDPDDYPDALARLGLLSVITTPFGEATIIVASAGYLSPHAASLLALVVAHAMAGRDRLRELDLLSHRADCDPLTGLRHSRPFDQRLAVSSPGRTAVIAVDVDDFKRINDEYGHQAGDHALLSLVEALRGALRGDDQLYRIGGDEFAVVIDVNGPGEVVAIARRLLEAARDIGQTVSVGAAVHMLGESGRDTLCRADKALYQAKRAGRDTARLAPSRAAAA